MQKILDVVAIKNLVDKYGLETLLQKTMDRLEYDFARWKEFDIIPRPAFHVENGVIELMPSADSKYFTYKYVNGHPSNPKQNKLTVTATGQFSTTYDGYPIFITEMTILTAIRTAATAALAAKYLARKNASKLAIIGTGAQSEFQIIAHKLVRDIKAVHYFDTDLKAMDKFERNIKAKFNDINFVRFNSVKEAMKDCDIVVVVTATKAQIQVVKKDWVEPGMFLSGLGGDCPGKTEFEKEILELPNSKVVVEFFDQSFIEGEIQVFEREKAKEIVYAQMNEICEKSKLGRENDDEITIFDSVGIGLEDFSMLFVINDLIKNTNIGDKKVMTPVLDDVKDLYGILKSNINVNNPQEFNAIDKKPATIADGIYKIAKTKKQFIAYTKQSCMCTVGVWSGAWKYYGEFGLIQIGFEINSSIPSLLGEGDREEKNLFDFIGKIKGQNYIICDIDYDKMLTDKKWTDRLMHINKHGAKVHFKSQVDKLGYEEILRQAATEFNAKGIKWGLSLTPETEKYAKKYLSNENFVGYEVRKSE